VASLLRVLLLPRNSLNGVSPLVMQMRLVPEPSHLRVLNAARSPFLLGQVRRLVAPSPSYPVGATSPRRPVSLRALLELGDPLLDAGVLAALLDVGARPSAAAVFAPDARGRRCRIFSHPSEMVGSPRQSLERCRPSARGSFAPIWARHVEHRSGADARQFDYALTTDRVFHLPWRPEHCEPAHQHCCVRRS